MTKDAIMTGLSARGRLVWVLIGVMLAGHAVLAFDTARNMSVTHDEYWHLPVGLLNWKTGRFEFDNLNPPLVRMFSALPLLVTDARAPSIETPTDPTGYGDRFQTVNHGRLQSLFLIGRCMIVLLSLFTGLILAIWSWKIFGPGSACLTVFLWSVSPTVLAHASLVTTDLGAAAFFTVTLFLLWNFASHPSWKSALIFGVVLGLAQIAKYTSLLLYPLSIILWFVIRFRNRDVSSLSKRVVAVQWTAALLVSLGTLNTGYFFRGSFSSLESYHFSSKDLSQISNILHGINAVPVPFPRDYLEGLDRQRHIMEQEHPVFLDQTLNTKGFGHYFLMALLYKVPHALQLLILSSAMFFLFFGREERHTRIQIVLLLPAISLITIASFSGMQLGLRYILPAFPFLILFAGQATRWLQWKLSPFRSLALSAIMVGMLLPLGNHPHHLAYFNEYVGGPDEGRYHLLDSNLDWGQDLGRLKEFVEANQIDDLRLAYFGTMPPEEYGIWYRLPAMHHPEQGWHAVSVNFVQGRPHIVRDNTGQFRPVGRDEFGYFRDFYEKKQSIGHSIDVYYLSSLDIRRWEATMIERIQ
jgi:hypothetical protein